MTASAVRAQLHNGRLTLYLDPIEDELKVGDEITLRSDCKTTPWLSQSNDKVTISIVDQEKEPKKAKAKAAEPKAAAKGKNKEPSEGKDEKPDPRSSAIVLLTRDGHPSALEPTQPWPEGFTEIDGGMIEDLGENGMVYKINYDNAYHMKYRLERPWRYGARRCDGEIHPRYADPDARLMNTL